MRTFKFVMKWRFFRLFCFHFFWVSSHPFLGCCVDTIYDFMRLSSKFSIFINQRFFPFIVHLIGIHIWLVSFFIPRNRIRIWTERRSCTSKDIMLTRTYYRPCIYIPICGDEMKISKIDISSWQWTQMLIGTNKPSKSIDQRKSNHFW